MGLIFDDVARWRRWQAGRAPVRSAVRGARDRSRRAAPPWLLLGSSEADLLVVLDARTPSALAAYAAPVARLRELHRVAVLAPSDPTDVLPAHPWSVRRPEDLPAALRTIRTTYSAGTFAPLGAAVHRSSAPGTCHVVGQHGLLTPMAPPPPPGAHLLAWTAADAAFWRSGRADLVTTVVGSQLLASGAPVAPAAVREPDTTPVYLGQLHGAELPRRRLAAAALGFCRAQGATYRPHPAETDRRSRAVHDRLRRAGVEVATPADPLTRAGRPVVGVFSTGILEAAARGIEAYAEFPDPPPWLREFWHRYDMRGLDQGPTPPPVRTFVEPATAIAAVLEATT